MAFTGAERIKIRKLLGWPAYASFDTALESAMDAVGADTDGAAETRTVLSNIATIESEMLSLHGIALAHKVEESTLNENRYRDLRAAGRREVQQLSILLNAAIRRDVFGGGWSGGFLRQG